MTSRRWPLSAASLLTVTLAAFATRVGAEKTDINVSFDKAFAFAGVRTWAWHPEGKGDVRMAVSSQDDPKQVAARVDPVIVPAVEREMAARGLTRAAEGAAADVYVHYYALATLQQSAQVHGQFLPAMPEWGVPPFVPSTSALSIFPSGTLIIDITSTTAKAIVWRGSATRTINIERPDSERRKVLEKAIRDLLGKFPPKK